MNPIPRSPDPSASKVIIHLIREELKSRKFFEGLRDLGLDDAFYQADLLELIMVAAGLVPELQEDYNFCHALFKKHSRRVVEDPGQLLDEARRVYSILQQHAARCSHTTTAAMPSQHQSRSRFI